MGVIVRFPKHPVHVTRDPDRDGWSVIWRGWSWQHDTYAAAMVDANKIATAHGQRVIIDDIRKDGSGGAA